MELRAKKTCAWAVSALLGTAMIGWSLDMKPASGQEVDSALVVGLRAGGAEVKPLGRRGVLEGWLVTPRGKSPYTLYVDESGHGVMGLLFSPDGRELTGRQVETARAAVEGPGDARKAGARREAPQGAVSEAARIRAETERMWEERRRKRAEEARSGEGLSTGKLPNASRVAPAVDSGASAPAPSAGVLEAALAVEGFDLGDAGPQVVVFADPTCVPSRAAVAELARRALGGELRLRVVPVGARGAEAEAMVELVLSWEDRAMAWFTLDRTDEWPALGADAAAGVALNRRLFERTGSEFVPYALMREPSGEVVSAVGLGFRQWFGDGAAQ